MSTKKFLSGLTAILIGINSNANTTGFPNPNKYLQNIPGHKIELEPATPSKYIIHIKQRHHVQPGIGFNLPEEEIERINKLSPKEQILHWAPVRVEYFVTQEYQEKIEQLLLNFADIGNTNIYSEGVFSEQSREELAQGHLSDLNELVNWSIIQKEERKHLTQLPGAARYLGIQGICRIVPGEDEELITNTLNSIDATGVNSPESIALNEKREDYLIEVMSKSENHFPITVFGRYHNLKNNIEEHNLKHPENQIGLITYEF